MRSNLEIEIELLRAQLNALEKRVNESPLMMRRPGSVRYEKLVDIVCDHEERLNNLE
jgi:hypothetical protein